MRTYQPKQLSAVLVMSLLAVTLTGCDKSNAKKITENTYNPITQSLGADNMSAKNPGNSESKK